MGARGYLVSVGVISIAAACASSSDDPAAGGAGGSASGGSSPGGTGGSIGGAGGAGGKTGGTTGLVPFDEPDDDAPYALAATCAELSTWSNVPQGGFGRVHALSRDQAWVLGTGAGQAIGAPMYHLGADGQVQATAYDGIHDIWGCELNGEPEVWAVGDEGTALRKRGDAAWEAIELDTDVTLRGGAGCGDEVWIGAADEVLVLRPDGITRLPMPLTPNGNPFEAARVHATGLERVVTAYYGTTMAWDVDLQDFRLIGDTDDLVTDAFVRRSGDGMSMHYGYAIEIHIDERFEHAFVPNLIAQRVHRRADDDVVIVGDDTVVFDDGVQRTSSTTLHNGLEDVHANADGVWVVGYYGAQILTDEGWCDVALWDD